MTVHFDALADRYPEGFPAALRVSAVELARDVLVLGVYGVAFAIILSAAVALEAERRLVQAAAGVE